MATEGSKSHARTVAAAITECGDFPFARKVRQLLPALSDWMVDG
jgi:hypothetical protein